ncbi:hypothetical protein REPUB_Repub17cG0048700 [Reevesia pubescens]
MFYLSKCNWHFDMKMVGPPPPKDEVFCWQVLTRRLVVKVVLANKGIIAGLQVFLDLKSMDLQGAVGIGRLLQEADGSMKPLFFKSIVVTDANYAKLMAVKEAFLCLLLLDGSSRMDYGLRVIVKMW